MDLQNKYQILASEFSKVRGQVTVLKKAVIEEQTKNQQLQEDINQKDQNLRRNAQEIEALSFLNTQLKSRLEILQLELQEHENHGKLRKTNSNKTSNVVSYQGDILAQELEMKIKQHEAMHRRVTELEKQLIEYEVERSSIRMTIEDLQNQMIVMQDGHQRARDEYDRILKQMKQENELLNEQIKHHLNDQSQAVSSRKQSVVNAMSKMPPDNHGDGRPDIVLFQSVSAWRDSFNELTIYIEERLRNNQKLSENHEKVVQTAKAFQYHAENFLGELKSLLFDSKRGEQDKASVDYAELFSTFVLSCEKVLIFAMKSICDEPKSDSSIESPTNICIKIEQFNQVLYDLFTRWTKNLSELREITLEIIRLASSEPIDSNLYQQKINELLTTFQTGSLIHCDLDKTYNDKLCLEYELNGSSINITTTDECILASLRKLASLEQQIAQSIRENQNFVLANRKGSKSLFNNEQDELIVDSNGDTHQKLLDIHKKQVLYNAETIGTIEQEREHWRLEYQLLKIKFEKMRDDYSKEIENLKEKTNQTTVVKEQFEEMISTQINVISGLDKVTNDHQKDQRSFSEPPSERELLIKQYYSQKIIDLETKLQLANGKGIAFYNELANIHQRLKHAKDQEVKCRAEIEQVYQELAQMKDELATTTKNYEEQIAAMSEHLASMNEQVTSQNEKIDKLQQQIHSNSKDSKKSKK